MENQTAPSVHVEEEIPPPPGGGSWTWDEFERKWIAGSAPIDTLTETEE